MSKKVKFGLTAGQLGLLVDAWSYADDMDKSTEWMLQYMQDTARVSLDAVLYFLKETPNELVTDEDRADFWYKRLNP